MTKSFLRGLLICILPLCFSPLTSAQVADSTAGLKLFEAGTALFDSAKYEMAGLFFKQAQEEFQYNGLWEHYADAVEAYASCFHSTGDHLKSMEVLKAGIDTVEYRLGPESFFTGMLYNSLGAVYVYKGQCQKAFPLIKKGIRIMEKVKPNHQSLGSAYNNLGACADIVEGLKESLEYYEKALDLFLNRFGEEHERVAMVCTNIGWTYSALGDYDKQGEYYQKSLDIRRKIYGGKHVKLVPNYINMGAYHYRRGNYAKMFEYAQKSLRNIRDNHFETHPYLSTVYLNHASYYDAIKDYESATPYYLKSIEDDIHNLGAFHPNLAVTYFNLAGNFANLENYDKAIFYYQKGREVCVKSQEVNPLDVANGYRVGGRIYLNRKDFQQTLSLFSQAMNIYINTVDENHPRILNILLEIAEVYGKQGNRIKQLETYYRALDQYFSSRSTDDLFLGNIYQKLAHYYAETDLQDSTRNYVQKSMKLFCGDLIESENYTLPPWSEMAFPEEMIAVLKLYGALQLESRETTVDQLKSGLHAYSLAAQVIDSLRFNQASFSGKRDLGTSAASVYEGGIRAAISLQELTGDDAWFDQAFIFAERGKSTLLYQSIQETEARISAGIPASVYALETDIKLSLMFYRNKIHEETAKPGQNSAEKIALWRSKIFSLTQTKDSLIARLEKDYPRYFELKYATSVPGIARIQDLLKKQQADILAYFEGEKELYVFWISESRKNAFVVTLDFPLAQWIDSFRTSIYVPFTQSPVNDSLMQKMMEAYASYGHQLYNRLIPSEVKGESFKDRKLIIIPDGSLGYLPFEGLLTQKPEKPGRYRNYSYLLKDVSLSYAYSATLLFHDYQPRQLPLPKKRLIAFSPGFGVEMNNTIASSRSELGELTYSKPEVEAVKNSLGGDVFLDEEATEERFKSLAGTYQIIHISSHAMVNDQKPLRSQIAFSLSQDTTEDDFLSLEELFHLRLPAEMVVLSACETGIGKLYRGEGISSLARGFSYAGSRSIITTLWKVNDEATAQIMAQFYQNLDQGISKDESLRLAKLAYLETADNLTAHPFYWSGYVPIGNMMPVEGGENDWWWVVLIFILLGVGFGRYWKRVR
ncbi:MAG: CHAT domain-containing protein [Bacteroidetes bacterium]|nr:CHAT domain-containing protein [Bacteroidota bacterium]